MQPTRMPQGGASSAFSYTELMKIVLGEMPRSQRAIDQGYDDSEPSLFSPHLPGKAFEIQKLGFYMDDIFSGSANFDEASRS